MIKYLWLLLLALNACSVKTISVPQRKSHVSGSQFYSSAYAFNWQQRDSAAINEVLEGNIPRFFVKFTPVHVEVKDSATGKVLKATYYVSPDYLSIGTDKDWARINITPRAAQKIADSLLCFLPTRKMVDDIYKAAKVKLDPVPMYAFRDSTPTMYQHHLIIEGQRKGRKGLIAGIKKDVVLTAKLSHEANNDRVAIYGWHLPGGKPIQLLYTGHVWWWVDYSQGIRLVYQNIRINGKWMDYRAVLKDPVLQRLLCDEQYCDYYRYPY